MKVREPPKFLVNKLHQLTSTSIGCTSIFYGASPTEIGPWIDLARLRTPQQQTYPDERTGWIRGVPRGTRTPPTN
uniref:Uncharacterized protein n=1 Tax=Arundo donax TaxID=35708 RepID=A0A0A9BX29_ARUDO